MKPIHWVLIAIVLVLVYLMYQRGMFTAQNNQQGKQKGPSGQSAS